MSLGPQFTQLQMLMTGSELKKSITSSLDQRYTDGSLEGMWDRKVAQSQKPAGSGGPGAGVYDSLKERGYDDSRSYSPHLTMDHFDNQREIPDGHHRVAAAAQLEKDTGKPVYIPVRHSGW